MVLSLRDWTRSANFIYETLAAYKFSDTDITSAMAATRGAGSLVDVVAWLCFHVPADQMPVDMRDKLEYGFYSKPVRFEQPKPAALSKDVRTIIAPEPVAVRAVEPDRLLENLLRSRHLDTDGSDGYESDEDPSVIHARRVVRVNACSEILDFYRNGSIVRGMQKKANMETVMAVMTRETKLIAELEQDVLFVAQTATAGFNRLWREHYGPLLEDIRDLEVSYNTIEEEEDEQEAATVTVTSGCGDHSSKEKKADSDDNDSVVGFGLDLLSLEEEDDETSTTAVQTPTTISRERVVDSTPPAGWTGAGVQDLVMEAVRRLDKQADIRYQTTGEGLGYTARLSVGWSQPAKARQIVLKQRKIPIEDMAPEFEQNGLTHVWPSPAKVFGKTKRAAPDLAALVFLYMQQGMCHGISMRLAPALHEIWVEWETASLAESSHARAMAVAKRIEFLRDLRKLYEDTAVSEENGDEDDETPVENSLQPNGRPASKKKRDHVLCARRIRSQQWSHMTLKTRLSTAEWKTKYGTMQQELPARKNAGEIRKAIVDNQVVIIRGETGSGKSSQVPQLVLDLLIGNGSKDKCYRVGVQIRFNSQACVENALVFCTTGVLLRMLIDDPELRDVNCIICDEVQERTLELDYMLIIVRKLLRKRPGLKVILMSATIDARIFTLYFDDCPVVEIPGRTFPVKQVFLEDVVEPSGYTVYNHRLYSKCGYNDSSRSVIGNMRTDVVNLELVHFLLHEMCVADKHSSAGVDQQETGGGNSGWQSLCLECAPTGSVLVFLPGIYEIRALMRRLFNDPAIGSSSTIIPLHSSFANDTAPGTKTTYTDAAFAPPAPGTMRKIVLSTNVAETGITIPDITIVFDCGLSNQSRWDKERRLTRLEKLPISKANVRQRCGHAGRVKPGLAICLFTVDQYQAMAEFELAEMKRMSMANICLQTKAHGFKDIMFLLQQAPEPPQQSSVMQAIFELQEAGALDEDEELTPIGKHLCYMPLDLSVGKLLVIGTMLGCLDPILTIAASMSINNSILLAPSFSSLDGVSAEPAHEKYRTRAMEFLPYLNDNRQVSDFLVVLAAYEDWRKMVLQPNI
ncbi:hypothetical protein EV175_003919 [Coemansia sp. RSA 1933]|nr:hypothetical protein EV175_003919 [Coemansia sp. RSA 1933]